MDYKPHVLTKHEIEYGREFNFSNKSDEIWEWLTHNGVDILGAGDCGELPEWEIDKSQLERIPEDAYKDIKSCSGNDDDITANDLRAFVKELLRAPTGDFAYISWF